VDWVSVLKWEPLMDELSEHFVLQMVEAAESNLDNLPLDQYGGRKGPLKFVLQILEVSVLGGGMAKGGLEVVDDNLSLDAKMGIASHSPGIQE